MTRKSKGQSLTGKTVNRMSDASKAKILMEYSKNEQLYHDKPLSSQVTILSKQLGKIEYLTPGSLAHTAKVAGIRIAREPRIYKPKIDPTQQKLTLVKPLEDEEILYVRKWILKHRDAMA